MSHERTSKVLTIEFAGVATPGRETSGDGTPELRKARARSPNLEAPPFVTHQLDETTHNLRASGRWPVHPHPKHDRSMLIHSSSAPRDGPTDLVASSREERQPLARGGFLVGRGYWVK